MKKKFIKMNDGKNYLSLGNIINIIKKHSKVEASGIQKEVFCGVFNINDIKTTTVNNYLIGYRPIGIEYKKIYLDLKENYYNKKEIFIPIFANIISILEERIIKCDDLNIKIINENSKIKKVCLDILHLKDENISNNFIEKINNYLDNNNYYEALIELLFYGVLENKQPIFDEVIININEYELKEYLKINLYEGISYINSLKILAQKDNMYANAQLGSLEYSGLISGKIDYEKCYEYYMKAALKGHPKASWMIGNLIFSNKVKEKNVDIMLKFLNKAVDLGSIAALNTLGRYYLNIDDVTALKYFKKAAEYGYAYAYNNLGMYYEKNNDLKLAKNYYKLSADLLNSWALNKMGEICINEGNYKDALFYFNKAINCPISERSYYAYYNLAKIYKSGNKKLNISKNEKVYNKYMNIFQNKKES